MGLLYGRFATPQTDVPVVAASLSPPSLSAAALSTPAPASQWVGENRVAATFDRLLDTTASVGPRPVSFSERFAAADFMPAEPRASFDERFPTVWAKAAPAPMDEKALAAQIAAPAPKPSIVLASLETSVDTSIPMPRARPAEARNERASGPSQPEVARENDSVALANAPAEQPSFFQKLFGAPKPVGPVLAYAPSDGGIPGLTSKNAAAAAAGVDRYTAVYDISAKTVYLPDGTRLEAHSGLGNRLDDPRYVGERMRGATPPHIYDLSMRESLFHGVQAIRLKPVGGEGNVYGRTGLLAHTYMLGPNGDSNGCVSFRNYDQFLRAFRSGEIKRLLVVAKL